MLLNLLAAAAISASAWTASSPLPEASFGHALVSARGFLYHVGGMGGVNGAGSADRVYVAPVSGGSVGAWSQARPLPEFVFFHAALAVEDRIFVLGGYHANDQGLTVSNVVYVADVAADGSLSEWRRGPDLPEPVFYPSAAAWNGWLYLTGGWNGASLTNAVHAARVNADGSLGAWQPLTALPEGVYTHAAVSNGVLYVLGGVVNGGTEIQSAVLGAPIAADGSIGAWGEESPLPQPLSNHGASMAEGRVIVTGGWTGTQATADAVTSLSGPDGLGAWSAFEALPAPLYLHGQAAAGGHLFVTGGTDGQTPTASVWSTPLPAAPPPPAPADSLPPRTTLAVGQPQAGGFISPLTPLSLAAVDDGAQVGDAAGAGVQSTLFAVGEGSELGAYSEAVRVPTDGRHVLRFLSIDVLSHREEERRAELAVDARAPVSTISPARDLLGSADAVSLAAVDEGSGVLGLEASVDGGPVAAYDGPFALSEGAHTVSYRAVDNVGNAETWREASFTVDLTAPVTTLEVSGTAATLTSEAGAAITYSLDGGADASYAEPVSAAPGVHTISFFAVDAAGNAEARRSETFTLADPRPDPAAQAKLYADDVKVSGRGSIAADVARAARTAPPAGARSLGAVRLSGQEILSLEAGDHFADSVELTGQARLHFLGRAALYVAGAVKVSGNAALGGASRFEGGRAQAKAQSGKAHGGKPALEVPKPSAPTAASRLAARAERKANSQPRMPLAGKKIMSVVAASGGQVRGAERAAVEIPSGAAAAALAVTVAPAETPEEAKAAVPAALEAAGKAVEFGPHGTRFAKAVTLELPFETYHPNLVAHYWNESRREWEPLPSVVDRQAKVVRAQTTHFSLYQVLAPFGAGASGDNSSITAAYAFPSPARSGQTPTIRVEGVNLDGVELKVYDVSGELKHQAGYSGYRAQYDFPVAGLSSGVYIFSVKANGQSRRGRLAVIR